MFNAWLIFLAQRRRGVAWLTSRLQQGDCTGLLLDVGPGDEFATAMACLILQIPDSFLPIFQR